MLLSITSCNSTVIVDKTDNLDKMENLLNDTQKFEKSI